MKDAKTESFWAIPAMPREDTPLAIMREQANMLTAMTGCRLRGVVSCGPHGEGAMDALEIAVPAMRDYRYSVLRYCRPAVAQYPGRLVSDTAGMEFDVSDRDGFVKGVKEILSSDPVANALGVFLALDRDLR